MAEEEEEQGLSNFEKKRRARKAAENVKLPDVTMSRAIMLGIVEALTGPGEVKSIEKKIMGSSDWNHKLNRGKQFERMYEYMLKGLAQDPALSPNMYGFSDEPELSAQSLERRATECTKRIAPGYVEGSISYIACEFNWLSSMTLIDYDNTAEPFEEVSEELMEELVAAEKRLYMPAEFELCSDPKFVGKKLESFKMKVNGINIVDEIHGYCDAYAEGIKAFESGHGNSGREHLREAGMFLVQLSELREKEPTEVDSEEESEGEPEEQQNPANRRKSVLRPHVHE